MKKIVSELSFGSDVLRFFYMNSYLPLTFSECISKKWIWFFMINLLDCYEYRTCIFQDSLKTQSKNLLIRAFLKQTKNLLVLHSNTSKCLWRKFYKSNSHRLLQHYVMSSLARTCIYCLWHLFICFLESESIEGNKCWQIHLF